MVEVAVRNMIRELVGFDTTSRNSNLELIHHVRDYLARHGVSSQLVLDDEGRKANLFATLGPNEKRGGVVLSGHTDVVPVDGQPWSSDPFEVVERDGRLYGRGTADMKSFIATALSLTPEFVACGLKVPVHFAFTYDEETDCAGIRSLIASLEASGYAPRAVIIGEPTSMRVVNSHKGGANYMTTITGREAHSSLTHQGVNAVEVAATLIAHLKAYEEGLKGQTEADNGFDPYWSTLSVGTIEGGTATNIVARECRFSWDWRPIPGHSLTGPRESLDRFVAELLPRLRAVAPEADIVTDYHGGNAPLAAEEGSDAETLVMALAETNQAFKVSYGTEGPYYQHARMPVVIFGPGSIEQAHKPDEFIALEQVTECTAFLRKLMSRLSAP